MSARVAVFAALLGLTACGPKVVDLAVNVVSTVCDPDLDPFQGVNVIEVRVTGPGLDSPLLARSNRADGRIEIPDIPAGPKRQIEVRGLAEESSPRPISIGRSLPFTIPDVLTSSNSRVELNIFMRKIDSFTPPSSVGHPQDCSRMRIARAGHTATLLLNDHRDDGRVFIVGGFNFNAGKRTAAVETEFFNPATGTFEDGPNVVIGLTTGLPKAFHTATLLPNGQVLLHGGENYPGTTPTPSTAAVIFDPDANSYGLVPPRRSDGGTPGAIARTRHLAIPTSSGRVLIVGGQHLTSGVLTPTGEIEWYEPEAAQMRVVEGDTLLRVGAAASTVIDGGVAVIAGGTDGNNMLTDEVVFFKYDGSTFTRAGATQHLMHARRGAAATTLADDRTVMVMGGYSDVAGTVPESSSEVIKTATNSIEETSAGIGTRGDVCAAILQQGNVLVVGGRGVGGASDGSATLVRFDVKQATLTSAAAAPLKGPRYFHTCTTLADGSVLVTGGMSDDTHVLQDAWIYTPIPGE